MKRILFLLFSFISKEAIAQVNIDWAICVEEKTYQYTNAKTDGFVIKNKRIKFCYNRSYFGFDNGNGYIQVFPLESWNTGVDRFGNVTEEFINGECPNYARGDMMVTITHSKPQTVLIQNTREITSYAYYIETNSLYTGKVTVNKNPSKTRIEELAHFKIDSFINYSEHWGNGTDTGIIGECKLNFLLHKDGTISNVKCIESSKNSSTINRKYFNGILFDKKLNEVFLRMPVIKTDFKKGEDSKYFYYRFTLMAYN